MSSSVDSQLQNSIHKRKSNDSEENKTMNKKKKKTASVVGAEKKNNNNNKISLKEQERQLAEQLVWLVDAKESELINLLPVFGFPYDYVIGNLDISDAMLCIRRTSDFYAPSRGSQIQNHEDIKKKDGNKIVSDLFYYNPVLEHFNSTAALKKNNINKDDTGITHAAQEVCDAQQNAVQQWKSNGTILEPLFALERKRADDLSNSITGKSKDPGFVRYKDQKLRMKQFQKQTGCSLLVVLEEYQKYEGKKYVASLPEDSFHSALVHTIVRDKIPVIQTFNFIDSLRVMQKISKEVVDKVFTNEYFGELYRTLKLAVDDESIPRPSEDAATFQAAVDFYAECLRSASLDGTQATQKLITDHSQIVSVRKKENRNFDICFQMMLMCVVGISEVMAKAIMKQYKSMPELIKAYEKCNTKKKREEMLAECLLESFTSLGNRRKLGPAKSKMIYETLYKIAIGSNNSNADENENENDE